MNPREVPLEIWGCIFEHLSFQWRLRMRQVHSWFYRQMHLIFPKSFKQASLDELPIGIQDCLLVTVFTDKTILHILYRPLFPICPNIKHHMALVLRRQPVKVALAIFRSISFEAAIKEIGLEPNTFLVTRPYTNECLPFVTRGLTTTQIESRIKHVLEDACHYTRMADGVIGFEQEDQSYWEHYLKIGQQILMMGKQELMIDQSEISQAAVKAKQFAERMRVYERSGILSTRFS